MIEADKRHAIYFLHKEGMGINAISRRMVISPKTVMEIVKQKGIMPLIYRKDKITIDEELLRSLYVKCSGWSQRIHEILTEEHGIRIEYSTLLTRQ